MGDYGPNAMSEWSTNIKKCPWQKVVWVQNDAMQKPLMATRGYVTELGVHPDNTFFTTVLTPDDEFYPSPAGMLCCPTKWRPVE